MRWKLLVLVSVIAAALALVLWSAVAIALFGSARVMARNDWILFVSLLIPFIISIFAGFFVYRHTASRRKSQALIATVLVIIFLHRPERVDHELNMFVELDPQLLHALIDVIAIH